MLTPTDYRPWRRNPGRGLVVSLMGLLWLLGNAPAAVAGQLAAHKATYLLSMHKASRGNEVTAVTGRLEVSFEASCDGWKIEQFLGFILYGEDGELLEHLARVSSFEARDGSEFIFNTRAFKNRAISEELSGVARRGDRGEPVEVRYTLPERQSELLPADTLFPGQHVERILAAANAGQRSLLRTVFDGSTEDNPFEISTFIGKPSIDTTSRFKPLRQHTRWPLRLAYFNPGATQPAPEFEMSIQLYDHGIAGDMLYDYGDFSIDVKLNNVQMLPMPGAC